MKTDINPKWKPSQMTVCVLLIQMALFFAIIFDIPVVRQIIGFIYLTFVPGLLILGLLKLKLERPESVVFVVGISIAFLMIVGLLTSLLGSFAGLSRPLSLIPLMAANSVIVLLLLSREWTSEKSLTPSIELRRSGILLSVLAVLVVTSIWGTMLVNASPRSNYVLLLMLMLISMLVGVVTFFQRLIPAKLHSVILFAIAVAILFHVSLFSRYIFGGDIFGEYSVYKLTLSNSYWNPIISDRLNDMLSITILPTTYSTVLNLEGTYVLKIVYPLIFALVPVGLYQLFKSRTTREVAFLAVFFFVSNSVFYTDLTQLARQMIAEFFYVLLFLVIFKDNIERYSKWFLFVFFGFGLVVSHYAVSYIFLAFASAFWLLGFLRKRKTKISLIMVLMFATMTFGWYIYTSSSTTFNDLINMINNIRDNFATDFLNPQSRGGQVLQGTGLQGIGTFWHLVGRYVFYATELLVVIGIVSLIIKRRKNFFNDEYNMIAFLNLILVIACIVVPNLATSFTMTRFYHLTLFFLAPFCILGGIDVLKIISRRKLGDKYLVMILLVVLLVPYLLFQTGFVYEVAREECWSLPLSGYTFDTIKLADMGVIRQTEVLGATWLSMHKDLTANVYSDITSHGALTYGNVSGVISLVLDTPVRADSYVYLREYNIREGVIFSGYGQFGAFNVTQINPVLNSLNLIYTSGSCEIFSTLHP